MVPQGLDLAALLETHALRSWTTNKRLSFLLCFIDLMSRRGQGRAEFKDKGLARIPFEEMKRLFGWRLAAEVPEILHKLGIIDPPTGYQTSASSPHGRGYAKGYRLSEAYSDRAPAMVPCLDQRLAKALSRNRHDRTREVVGTSPTKRGLMDSLTALCFSGSAETALQASLPTLPTWEARTSWLRSYHELQSRCLWLREDPNTGRLFHNVTSMPKALRAHLLIDQRPVVEIDVSCCQPFLMATLYREDCQEREKLLQLTSRGWFYEHLLSLLPEKPQAELRAQGRDVLKKRVQVIINDRLRPTPSPLLSAFQQEFPVLAGRIAEIKAEDHARLPLMLQKAEADIVIGRVLPRIQSLDTAIPAVSIHDCILCPTEHREQVQEILSQEFFAATGAHPCLKAA